MSNATTVHKIKYDTKMWNCGVLLLCVFVMVPQGALCKFTDKKNFKNPDSRGSSYRGASPSLTQRRQLQPRPTALTVTQANDFRQKLHGIKHKVCPDNETCASKCCPKGQGRDISEGTCSDLPREFNPLVKEAYSEGTEAKVSNEFLYLEGLIGCNRSRRGQKEYTRRVRALKREFHLLPNGSLFMESDRAAGPGMHFEINKYCIDWFITADDEIEYDAIICYIPRPFKMHRDMTIACILITCVLVLLRVVAFACLPELRTLHGKILLAYLISFFVALLLMVSQMFLTNGNKINREACSVLSFIVYFVTLLAFFWRNVMCYDIWWTFSGKRAKSVRGSSTRFCLYCAYAFGWPTVLTALMVALEFSAFSHEHDLMPKVWDSGCKGLHGYARLMYYYGPILTLFVINMVLFALTALKIAWIKKETRTVLKSKESGLHDRNNDVERFTLYANLFASMLFLEVNWILDSVTIFYPDARNGSIVTDFCNLAVLLFIFFNFVCKKRTWKMIIKRYQHIRGRSSGLTTVTSNNRTLTSQTSQTSQSQDTITTEQWNTAVSQNKTESCDIKREKSSLVESQEDNITNKYSRDSQNPDLSQEDIQPLDSIQNNSSPAESQGVTQSLDFIREKSSLAESQEYTQSLDFIRETSSPVEILDNTQSPDFVREKLRRTESQECTQSLDFIRENSSLADSQEYSQSLNFIREKSSPAESQEYNQSPEFIREKLSPVQILDNTQSPDFIREQSTPAESQECTQSLDFIREKSSPAESQANTQSPDFIREKSSPADSQEDTQSPDFIREKSSPAETQEDTQSLDFIHEKSSPSEFQNNTQSPDFSRHKTFPNEEPDDIQAAEIIVETQRTMARNALCQPTSFQRSRTLPRPGAALNHLNAVQKRQSLLRSSLRDPSINTDGATSSKAVFN